MLEMVGLCWTVGLLDGLFAFAETKNAIFFLKTISETRIWTNPK